MSAEYAIEVLRLMLTTSLVMVTPMLVTSMVVGLVVSLLQAITSLQEQTLSFVPKLFAVAVVMMLIAFWLVEKILTFTVEIFNRIATLGGA